MEPRRPRPEQAGRATGRCHAGQPQCMAAPGRGGMLKCRALHWQSPKLEGFESGMPRRVRGVFEMLFILLLERRLGNVEAGCGVSVQAGTFARTLPAADDEGPQRRRSSRGEMQLSFSQRLGAGDRSAARRRHPETSRSASRSRLRTAGGNWPHAQSLARTTHEQPPANAIGPDPPSAGALPRPDHILGWFFMNSPGLVDFPDAVAHQP